MRLHRHRSRLDAHLQLQANGVDLLEAAERCAPDVREALNFAAGRIERYLKLKQ